MAPLTTTFSVYNLERNNTFNYSKVQTELGYHTRLYVKKLHNEIQWPNAEGLV